MNYKGTLNCLEKGYEKAASSVNTYLRDNYGILTAIVTVVIAAYGFELFNLNLTIDEEIHATFLTHTRLWILQGRWGMYLLNKFIFPYTVVPFMPLFLALVFNLFAMVLLFVSWGGKSKTDLFLTSSLGTVFPTLAYMYTFSIINYGIGIGLFFVALSLFIFSKTDHYYRYLAVLPAAFALAIYQGFLPVLLSVFLIYFITIGVEAGRIYVRDLFYFVIILFISFLLYYAGQSILVRVLNIPLDRYIAGYFNLAFLLENLSVVFTRLFSVMRSVYFGDNSVFAIDMPVVGVMLIATMSSFILNLWRRHLTIGLKFLLIFIALCLIILPFFTGILNRGFLSIRFLLTVPVTLSGLVLLGMRRSSRVTKSILFVLTFWCIFQSCISTNRLFASSHLALQEDRLFASRLITRIEDAINESGNRKKPKYLEVVGFLERKPTQLIPIKETFGASFFSWDEGNPQRIVAFLETVGFKGVVPLPVDGRLHMVHIAEEMPVWPAQGSVRVVDETILIKFGPYSNFQKSMICGDLESTNELLDFCP